MIDELAGRRLWIGIPGPRLDDAARRLLEEVRPGGVVLFARNDDSKAGLRALSADLRALLGDDLHVAVDQEGGLVARFEREFLVWPGNMALGAASVREPSLGEHLAVEQGRLSAAELVSVGVDVNLAPVLDLASAEGSGIVSSRSFGSAPELVARLGAACVRGTLSGGVLPCLKHFPGLGHASSDPHLALAHLSGSRLEDALLPFERGIAEGAPLVMSTHLVVESIDPGVPATFSRAVMEGLLRERLGFRGVTLTDDLEMGALGGSEGFDEIVRAAAGAHDVLLVSHDADRQRRAARILSEEHAAGRFPRGGRALLEERLASLRRPESEGVFDARRAAEVAEAIAGRSVTVIRDDRGLIPIEPETPVLILRLRTHARTEVEDPLRGVEPAVELAEALSACRPATEILETPPSDASLTALMDRALEYERVVLLLADPRSQAAEGALLEALAGRHPGCLVVLLRDPHGAALVPEDAGVAVLTPHGFRRLHIRALARVLQGDVAPYGRLPVEV